MTLATLAKVRTALADTIDGVDAALGQVETGALPNWDWLRSVRTAGRSALALLDAEAADGPSDASGQERIVRAAIFFDCAIFSVPQPGHHGDVIILMTERLMVKHSSANTHYQGFLTSTGRFVDRRDALTIAKAAGQMKPVKSGEPDDPELYSEDVW